MSRFTVPRSVKRIWALISGLSVAAWLWGVAAGAAATFSSLAASIPLGWAIAWGLVALLAVSAMFATVRESRGLGPLATSGSVAVSPDAAGTEGGSGSATVSAATSIPKVSTGRGDVTPPELHGFEIMPRSVDISGGPAVITITAELSDRPAGLAGDGYKGSPTHVRFLSTGGQFLDAEFQPHLHLVGGDKWRGVYERQIEVPMYSEEGTWAVEYFLLVDQVGNQRRMTASGLEALGFPTSFEVAS